MIYEGIALNPSFTKGRKSGSIEIRMSELVFKDTDGVEYKLPLKNINITQGGTGNRYVYFKNDSIPDITIYTDNKQILNHEELKFDYNHKSSISKIKNNRRILWLSVYSIVGIFVLTIVSFYIFRNKIVEHIAKLIPPSVEQSVTEQIKKSILVNKKVIKSPFIDSQLFAITKPLVDAVENKDFKFSFTIIEDETMNAFALPGGTIMIHSGLIEKAKNANEIAGVLAHEISHVTRQHHMRGIIGNLGMFTIVRGFLGDVAGISSDLIAVGATLESMSYSRDFERESDNSGFDLLIKAGESPQGMISFFETLKKENGSIQVANFLSTHPDVEERIKNLNIRMKTVKVGGNREANVNFKKFKAEVKKQVETK